MSLSLGTLKAARGARTQPKRVGRGNASGKGTTAGRGGKGQSARTGGRKRTTRLGLRRLMLSTPKLRGFKALKAGAVAVNVGDLAVFAAGSVISPRSLKAKGLMPPTAERVKILGMGDLKKKLIIEHCAVSASAKEKIEAVGGEIR